MEEQNRAQRQIAFAVDVSTILDSRYVKEDGWMPNYLAVGDKKVSRVNVIGVIVSKEKQDNSSVQNFILDDGSGRIPLRFFESPQEFVIGSIVKVIGRPR